LGRLYRAQFYPRSPRRPRMAAFTAATNTPVASNDSAAANMNLHLQKGKIKIVAFPLFANAYQYYLKLRTNNIFSRAVDAESIFPSGPWLAATRLSRKSWYQVQFLCPSAYYAFKISLKIAVYRFKFILISLLFDVWLFNRDNIKFPQFQSK